MVVHRERDQFLEDNIMPLYRRRGLFLFLFLFGESTQNSKLYLGQFAIFYMGDDICSGLCLVSRAAV